MDLFCFPLSRPIISSSANSVKKPWIEQNCQFFLFSGKRSYYSGEQHTFPGSECQKQAQMQIMLDVESMLCPPKLSCDISGVLHETSTSFIHSNKKYLPILLYITENHAEKLICHLYLQILQFSLRCKFSFHEKWRSSQVWQWRDITGY